MTARAARQSWRPRPPKTSPPYGADSLHDMRGTLLCPDVVLVAYWIERTSKSTGTFASNSILVKRTGHWLRIGHQGATMSTSPSNPGDATRSFPIHAGNAIEQPLDRS